MPQISIAASAFLGAFTAIIVYPTVVCSARWLRAKLRRKPRCEICGQVAVARWMTMHIGSGKIDQRAIDLCASCLQEQAEAHAREREGGE